MPSLQVRDLPDHIYEKIVERAEAERRSIAQETIVLLEKALELGEQSKKRRRRFLDHIIQETQAGQTLDVPDPVPLVREDRER